MKCSSQGTVAAATAFLFLYLSCCEIPPNTFNTYFLPPRLTPRSTTSASVTYVVIDAFKNQKLDLVFSSVKQSVEGNFRTPRDLVTNIKEILYCLFSPECSITHLNNIQMLLRWFLCLEISSLFCFSKQATHTHTHTHTHTLALDLALMHIFLRNSHRKFSPFSSPLIRRKWCVGSFITAPKAEMIDSDDIQS